MRRSDGLTLSLFCMSQLVTLPLRLSSATQWRKLILATCWTGYLRAAPCGSALSSPHWSGAPSTLLPTLALIPLSTSGDTLIDFFQIQKFSSRAWIRPSQEGWKVCFLNSWSTPSGPLWDKYKLCHPRDPVPDVHALLLRYVTYDNPTTSTAFRYSGWISLTPGVLPLWNCLTAAATSATVMGGLRP